VTTPLSPTVRSTPRREKERAQSDRSALHDVLDSSLVCHLAVVVDGVPLALPTVFGVDLDGPDEGGTLYVHGSVASRSLVQGPTQDVSVTMTVLDGLVLARSGFAHSMNYRSAVVIGRPRVVDDPDERAHALDVLVDHVVPGRAEALRRPTRKELAATVVLALPLLEASVKQRTGDPQDEDQDVGTPVWCGVVPLSLVATAPVTGDDAVASGATVVPPHVAERARRLGAVTAVATATGEAGVS
jgi:nitroimidazol reductase NimA-like FMN-containing flavoprotein (pyridoxamine 5'-phosphate oxidase superfamily)